jgi:hypothetical protein
MFVEGSLLQIWLIAFFTLALLSVLFKENPVYRFVEHMYVGTSVGYNVMTKWFQYGKPTLSKSIVQEGKWQYIIPIIIALLIYTRYFKSISWLSRYSLSFTIGIGAAYVLTKDFKALIVTQIMATFKSLWVSASFWQTICNWVLVLGTVGTLVYFFFTTERKGVLGAGVSVGKWVMMVAFGSAFGNTVMGRVSLFLGRIQFLLGDWLHVIAK